jgi:hypothetical protein
MSLTTNEIWLKFLLHGYPIISYEVKTKKDITSNLTTNLRLADLVRNVYFFNILFFGVYFINEKIYTFSLLKIASIILSKIILKYVLIYNVKISQQILYFCIKLVFGNFLR